MCVLERSGKRYKYWYHFDARENAGGRITNNDHVKDCKCAPEKPTTEFFTLDVFFCQHRLLSLLDKVMPLVG